MCLFAPRYFFVKNSRISVLCWLVGGTFILVFWAVYFDKAADMSLAEVILATIASGIIGSIPVLVKKQKEIGNNETNKNTQSDDKKKQALRRITESVIATVIASAIIAFFAMIWNNLG